MIWAFSLFLLLFTAMNAMSADTRTPQERFGQLAKRLLPNLTENRHRIKSLTFQDVEVVKDVRTGTVHRAIFTLEFEFHRPMTVILHYQINQKGFDDAVLLKQLNENIWQKLLMGGVIQEAGGDQNAFEGLRKMIEGMIRQVAQAQDRVFRQRTLGPEIFRTSGVAYQSIVDNLVEVERILQALKNEKANSKPLFAHPEKLGIGTESQNQEGLVQRIKELKTAQGVVEQIMVELTREAQRLPPIESAELMQEATRLSLIIHNIDLGIEGIEKHRDALESIFKGEETSLERESSHLDKTATRLRICLETLGLLENYVKEKGSLVNLKKRQGVVLEGLGKIFDSLRLVKGLQEGDTEFRNRQKTLLLLQAQAQFELEALRGELELPQKSQDVVLERLGDLIQLANEMNARAQQQRVQLATRLTEVPGIPKGTFGEMRAEIEEVRDQLRVQIETASRMRDAAYFRVRGR